MERNRHKREVLNRLKSVEGHIRGIQRMVEDDQYCIDILKQTAAVQGALDKLSAIILENHLQTCVTTAIRGERQEERERVIRELMDVFHGGSNIGLHWREEAAQACHASPADDVAAQGPVAAGQERQSTSIRRGDGLLKKEEGRVD